MLDRIKYRIVGDLVEQFRVAVGIESVLDVGCRDCVLRTYLPKAVSYAGVDLFQNQAGTVEYVFDITRGLPFDDLQWDVVVALDVLEHVDDIQSAMLELWRVCRHRLVVVLPNMAHVSYRWKFLTSGALGTDKFDLSFPTSLDRHRWFTTAQQSDRFVHGLARSVGARVDILYATESPRRERFAKVARAVGLGPQYWAWSVLYVLSR